MKKKLTTLALIILCSCSPYKFKFVPTSKKMNDQMAHLLPLNKDELFLAFTSTYKDTKIKVKENKKTIYNGLITTNEYSGIAKVFKINQNSKITVKFEGIEKPLVIESKNFTNYKQVAISKKGKHVIIEFNNGKTKFKGSKRGMHGIKGEEGY